MLKTKMKSKNKPTAKRKPALPIFQFQFREFIIKGLAELTKKYPFCTEGVRISDPGEQQWRMAGRLIVLALAHIEKIAPLLVASIEYCEAEGIDQEHYLKALTEVKFKKKLHAVRRRRNPDEYDD